MTGSDDTLLYLAAHMTGIKRRRKLVHDLLERRICPRELHLRTIWMRYGIESFPEALRKAEKELRLCEEHGCRIVTLDQKDYPEGLKRNPTPPMAMWVKGKTPGKRCITVVGSRSVPRAYMNTARDVARTLAGVGYGVISGGAYGIDGAAHRGALDGGGATYVFLASGLDRPYPSRHAQLFETIKENGGVLSFIPLGTDPVRWGFLQRNGYMAACSLAVLIVAAHERSGALSTVRQALDMGVPVLAIPGTPGTRRAMDLGALSLPDPGEIESALTSLDNYSISLRPAPYGAILSEGPKSVEEIASRTGEPVSQVTATLTKALFDGLVVRVGGLYAPASGGIGHGKATDNRGVPGKGEDHREVPQGQVQGHGLTGPRDGSPQEGPGRRPRG